MLCAYRPRWPLILAIAALVVAYMAAVTLAEETETPDAAPPVDVEKADIPIGQIDEPCDTLPVSGLDHHRRRSGMLRQPKAFDGATLFGSARVARKGSYACDNASGIERASKRNLVLDGCPFCGLREPEPPQTGVSGLHRIPYLGRLLGDPPSWSSDWSSDCRAGEPRLRPGETAGSLLEIRERLGPSVLAGTTFGEQCAGEAGDGESVNAEHRSDLHAFVQWIRALEEEQQLVPPVEGTESLVSAIAEAPLELRVEALRKAGRELEQAADLLEQQNLFEQADEVRGVADRLRVESRRFVRGELP